MKNKMITCIFWKCLCFRESFKNGSQSTLQSAQERQTGGEDEWKVMRGAPRAIRTQPAALDATAEVTGGQLCLGVVAPHRLPPCAKTHGSSHRTLPKWKSISTHLLEFSHSCSLILFFLQKIQLKCSRKGPNGDPIEKQCWAPSISHQQLAGIEREQTDCSWAGRNQEHFNLPLEQGGMETGKCLTSCGACSANKTLISKTAEKRYYPGLYWKITKYQRTSAYAVSSEHWTQICSIQGKTEHWSTFFKLHKVPTTLKSL